MVYDKALVDHNIQQELQSVVTSLQLEFSTLYTFTHNTQGDDTFTGYWSLVNTEDIMTHFGSLLVHKKREYLQMNGDVPVVVVHGLIEIYQEGLSIVRTETTVFVLNALHSIYCCIHCSLELNLYV
jgi:hypothetical protein